MRAHNIANRPPEANNVLTGTWRLEPLSGWLLAGALCLGGCAGPDTHEASTTPLLSRFESEPPGASVFVDGGFVGTTPTAFHLPAKPSVHVRLELPGYFPVDTMLDRRTGLPPDAPPGTGWEDVYYWPLVRK